MATFQKRSGNWRAIVTKLGFPRQTRTFDSKSDAEAWARAVETEMDRGHFISRKEAENTTLTEALDRFEREKNKKGVQQYTSLVNVWKRHPLSKRFLASIQGKDIAEYRDKRLETVGAQTVLHEIGLLSRIYNTAIKEWGMGGLLNPVVQIRKPRMPKSRDRRLRTGEMERIVAATESSFLPDLVPFAVETGMRQGELAGMTWGLVDLKKRIATLPETKNGEKRNIPLSPKAVRILSDLLRRIDGKVWGIEPHSISQAFRKAVSRARNTYEKECEEKGGKPDPGYLVDLTFHDLRHEATSRFFEKGLNPMQVAAIT